MINYKIMINIIIIYTSHAKRRGKSNLDAVMPWSPMTLIFHLCVQKRGKIISHHFSLSLFSLQLIYNIFFNPTLFLFLSSSQIGKALPFPNPCAQTFILGFMSSSSSAGWVCLFVADPSFSFFKMVWARVFLWALFACVCALPEMERRFAASLFGWLILLFHPLPMVQSNVEGILLSGLST